MPADDITIKALAKDAADIGMRLQVGMEPEPAQRSRGEVAYSTATEAVNRRPWPRYTARSVSVVIAQLLVLRETLPAITDSDLFPRETRDAVAMAAAMLSDYSTACETTEREQEMKERARMTAEAYQRGALAANEAFQSSDLYREAERIIAARALKAEKRQKKAVKRG